MAVNNQSPYPLKVAPSKKRRKIPYLKTGLLIGVFGLSGTLLLPQVIAIEAIREQSTPVPASTVATAFPVSVNPAEKKIVSNPLADEFFNARTSKLTAAAGTVGNILSWIAALIDNTRLYQSIAGVDGHLVTVLPGYRKEQILSQLSYDLNWNKVQQQQFLTAVTQQTPGITDGMFAPGTYLVDSSMTPSNVAALMGIAFNKSILVHYSTSTESQVPLSEALTIASLLEREAKGPADMRVISGIIWNRLFNNMNLQIDATLQYAKGANTKGNWWQAVVPKDKYVSSAYNTYAHPGLPPGPIANPSLAAVLAALNPVQTSCLFYFHDSHGNFHCSDTYKQHVVLLKKYYGQGK